MTPKSERSQPAARRGKRVAMGIYVVLAATFVVGSTWQVERQVFGAPLTSTKTGPNCSYLAVAFEESVTRAVAHAALEHSREKADEAFEDIVTAPLSAVEKHCVSSSDRGAYVAALRLKEGAEATVDAQQSALAPLRAAVQARRNP